MYFPPSVLQDLLSYAISITGKARRMVCGAVTLHPKNVTVRIIRIEDPDVNEKPRHSNLRMIVEPERRNFSRNRLFEVAIERLTRLIRQFRVTVLCQLQKMPESRNAWFACALEFDVLGNY